MVAISSNFFYTVTLPVTLWFLDKAKTGTSREDTVLFLDARHTFRQIDRAHRDFLPEQVEFLANVVRLYRGDEVETIDGSEVLLKESFPDGQVRRRSRALQGRHPRRDRGAGVEPEPGPIRRVGRSRGRRRGLRGPARGAIRGVHAAQRRGRGAARESRSRCSRDSRRMSEWRDMTLGDVCILRAGNGFKRGMTGCVLRRLYAVLSRLVTWNSARQSLACAGVEQLGFIRPEAQRLKLKPFGAGTSVFAKIGEGRSNRTGFVC